MIHVIDAVMGTGKSSAVINMINQSSQNTHYIYVTPYLTEVQRIIDSCPMKHFEQPITHGTKLQGLKELLRAKKNIATTHALFQLFDRDVMSETWNNNYVLILDEVANVVAPYQIDHYGRGMDGITQFDLLTILSQHAEIDKESSLIRWTDNAYRGLFDSYKRMCELGSLAVYGKNTPLWLFPVEIFGSFRESYVLTYMFNAQLQSYYYNYYNLAYDLLYVDNIDGRYTVVDYPTSELRADYRSLIRVCDSEKMNEIGDEPNAMSKTWYTNYATPDDIAQLKNNTYNFFRHVCHSPASNNIWTTFVSQKKLLQGKGYTKGFTPCNVRATNEYQDRSCVAYLVNRYLNPVVKNFFHSHGIAVDEDGFALSEMLQFIWRSAIRNGQPIDLYIPSSRMRGLLERWIESHSM